MTTGYRVFSIFPLLSGMIRGWAIFQYRFFFFFPLPFLQHLFSLFVPLLYGSADSVQTPASGRLDFFPPFSRLFGQRSCIFEITKEHWKSFFAFLSEAISSCFQLFKLFEQQILVFFAYADFASPGIAPVHDAPARFRDGSVFFEDPCGLYSPMEGFYLVSGCLLPHFPFWERSSPNQSQVSPL